MRVAIIGAGIGGLVTACGLQREGAEVVVLERASQPPASGSGLSIFGNGWTALDSVGVGDRIRRVAGSPVPGLKNGQRRPDGTWLAQASEHALRELRILHRVELQNELLASLAPGTVRFGADVSAVDTEAATVSLGDADDLDQFDLVVAADGINSRVRAGWEDDPGTRYSGYSAWRGITSGYVDLLGAAGETWGKGQRFGYAPLRDGRVYWFAVVSVPEDSASSDDHRDIAALFRGWHDPIAAVIGATDPAVVFRLPIRDLARPLASFQRGRCVLLGDAAHAMTPDLGQGGNQAMEDAATLVALLADHCRATTHSTAKLRTALAEYDRLRRGRTQPIARRARLVGRVAQANGRISVPLRNAVMRMTPQRSFDSQLRAIQEWRPPSSSRQDIPAAVSSAGNDLDP